MAVLLGRQSAGTTADFEVGGATTCWSFVASASDQLAVIKAQTKVANPTLTGIRLGIYTDSAGSPSALLGVQAVDSLSAAQGTGVFQATLGTPISIVSGVTYWLGWFGTGENFDFQGDASGLYKSDLGTNFADPFLVEGTGTTNAILWGESAPVVTQQPKNPAAVPFIYLRQKS